MIERVLVVGDMRVGTNARSVADAYARCVPLTRTVDISPAVGPRPGSSEWISLKRTGLASTKEQARVRHEIRNAVTELRPQLLLAIKPIQYSQDIFLEAEVALKVHQSFDDVSNPDNTSASYLSSEHLWDAIVTTKQHNIAELKNRGARNVIHIWGAFDPQFRYKNVPYEEREFTVGFIGAARPDRIDLPRQLSSRVEGRSIVVGPRWRRAYPFGAKGVHMVDGAFGAAHLKVANQIQIGLLLLNSENRDTHTNRSFEMPATGQLVLGQRTGEHEQLFSDGESAVLFGTREEMWERLAELRTDSRRAKKIADEGHRIITGGLHTYEDRAREVLHALD